MRYDTRFDLMIFNRDHKPDHICTNRDGTIITLLKPMHDAHIGGRYAQPPCDWWLVRVQTPVEALIGAPSGAPNVKRVPA